MVSIGIDLGTTNSVIAACMHGEVQVISNALGRQLTPSVIGLVDDGIVVGEVAAERRITHPKTTASLFKRLMGSTKKVRIGRKSLTPPELSSLVLKSLAADAEAALGSPVESAVISVPAYFNDTQRKATVLAAQLAGIEVTRLINEPTAAAIAYGLQERPDGTSFLVLDLGGGTFDVSLMEYFDGVLEVLPAMLFWAERTLPTRSRATSGTKTASIRSV